MTIAARYARYSSDSQREESIDIQLREIDKVIDREGWTLGPTFTDEAVSGWQTHGRRRREDFDKAMEAAESGLYDVLVIYKQDRFARNVEVAQQAKRRLFRAGVRLVSVREGEIKDTPDGWFMSVMGDAMAEYYSRNLSVMVRNGIDQSARQLKAAGRRIYGYDTDDTDHFVINEKQAAVVREMFSRYLAGDSMTQICDWLNAHGIRTPRGKTWCTQNVAQLMRKDAYKGTYRYSGHVVEGGMPAIVSAEEFDRVQALRKTRKNMKRRKVMNDYLLTDKIYCLSCGRPMCGTAGTSATGRKYTYYGCVRKNGGCGQRISSEKVEDCVIKAIVDVLSDDECVDRLVADIAAYAKERPNHADEYREEASRLRREVERLVASIASGIPAESVREALTEREGRISDLEKLARAEDVKARLLPNEDVIREWLEPFLDVAPDDGEWRHLVMDKIVGTVFADKEHVLVALNVGSREDGPLSFEQVRELKNVRTTGYSIVRTGNVWWALQDLNL